MRRKRFGYLGRVVLIGLLTVFVWMEIQLVLFDSHITTNTSDDSDANVTSQDVLSFVPLEFRRFLYAPANQSTNSSNATHTIEDYKRLITLYNTEQVIRNEDIYGPLLTDEEAIVIVIQVHVRLEYLRHLVVSLAQARGIQHALLIFSHDHYDDAINRLVHSIDFCKVMQIFYPHSIQTHPKEFPGEDPHDCPRDIKREDAIRTKCNNALHPDVHGHYREARFTQTKHHWWWKAHMVFDQLDSTKYYSGPVLFIEEDHYMAEDFLYVLSLMEQTAESYCPECSILSLGTYLKKYNYYEVSDKKVVTGGRVITRRQSWGYQVLPQLYGRYQKVEIVNWISSKYNMGMAFNRTVWSRISECYKQFCSYDDYNWDWSLQYVSVSCIQPKIFKAIVCKGPRVFHIGECGFHHKKANCDSNAVISRVQKVLSVAKPNLFPSELRPQKGPVPVPKKVKKTNKGNGGWGDVRDHELCINITLENNIAKNGR